MAFHCVRCHAEIEKTYKACPTCGEPITDFLRRYLEEPVDGKYEILERLGAGGMGEVYKVRHKYLGSLRVIKVIRAQISDSREAHDRFLREARVATRVQHPNVATLHDFSALPDGSMYMVWEYIEGENIAQRQRVHGTFPPREAVRIAIEALYGLDAIHRAGIVHRDISPENVMIAHDEQGEEHVKIIDLGVAKSDEPGGEMTRTGMFLGKFRYSSPEHVGFLEAGEKIDGRADLYSLAIVLYEMLAGRPPFEATSPHEYIILHSRDSQFRPIDLAPDLPGGAALQDVLKRALERDRNKRYANAREFAAALVDVEKSLANATQPAIESLDETMRLKPGARGTLFRTTEQSDAAPTLQTPLPAPPPPPVKDGFEYTIPPKWKNRGYDMPAEEAPPRPSAAPTPPPAPLPVAAPPPAPAPAPPPGRATVIDPYAAAAPRRSSALPVLAAIFGVFLIAAVLAFIYFRRATATQQVASNTSSTAPGTVAVTSQSAMPPPSQTSIDVVTDTTPTIILSNTAPIGTTAPITQTVAPQPQPRPVPVPVPVPQPTETAEPEEEPEPEPQPASIRAYIEGGDSSNNDRLVEQAAAALGSVSRVAVRGSGDPAMTARLVNILRDRLTIDNSSDVAIEFFGKVEHLGRGRKRRIANVVVTKSGKPVFHYQLAGEYRVGDDPAEAFARVFEEVLDR
jgi:serine/threonine-protein kinase